jgi:hypothetical protein
MIIFFAQGGIWFNNRPKRVRLYVKCREQYEGRWRRATNGRELYLAESGAFCSILRFAFQRAYLKLTVD